MAGQPAWNLRTAPSRIPVGVAVIAIAAVVAAGAMGSRAATTASALPSATVAASQIPTTTASEVAAPDPYLAFRHTIDELATATAHHDVLAAGEFRARLAALMTPALRTMIAADLARLRADVVAATANHDFRMRAAFGAELTKLARAARE